MAKTAKMRLVELMVLKEDIDEVVEFLGKKGNFQFQQKLELNHSISMVMDKVKVILLHGLLMVKNVLLLLIFHLLLVILF